MQKEVDKKQLWKEVREGHLKHANQLQDMLGKHKIRNEAAKIFGVDEDRFRFGVHLCIESIKKDLEENEARTE